MTLSRSEYRMRIRDLATHETLAEVSTTSAAMTVKRIALEHWQLGERADSCLVRVQVHEAVEIVDGLGNKLGHWRNLNDSEHMVIVALVERHKRQSLKRLRNHYAR